jgi:hypothetical protein
MTIAGYSDAIYSKSNLMKYGGWDRVEYCDTQRQMIIYTGMYTKME